LEYWNPEQTYPALDPQSYKPRAKITIRKPSPDGALIPGNDHYEAQAALMKRYGSLADFLDHAKEPLDLRKMPDRVDRSNIVGYAIGARRTNNKYTGDLAVKVYVRRKAVSRRVRDDALIPSHIDKIPTDVVETGRIWASSSFGFLDRPVPCGVLIGNYRVLGGTLGCLVVLNDGKVCILSNNHILAALNDGKPMVDPILQPGPVDFAPGGIAPGDDRLRNDLPHRIGILYRFKPLVFTSDDPNAVNIIDAAVAFTTNDLVKADFPEDPPGYILSPKPIKGAVQNTVEKYGCESFRTIGDIIDINASIDVTYPPGKVARFREQYKIKGRDGPFAVQGDSGALVSLIATDGNRPLGLQFANDSSGFAYANPIGEVMRQLGIRQFLTPAGTQ
jgi:hypothetical protein